MVESGSFENCYSRKVIEGSNPSASAKSMFKFLNKKKKEPENLEEVLSQFKELKADFENVSQELNDLKKESRFCIQKIGMIRFNPFKGVGSDQSFSVAFLDANNSGIVITSLYAREENRIYGKPIKAGQSEYQLSEEEKEAINKANNGNNNSKNKRRKGE